jgi:hypothetical protein
MHGAVMINTLAGITRIDIWVTVAVSLCIILIWKAGSVINVGAIQELVTVLNTKGGIILILGVMSLLFFAVTIWLIFTIIQDLKAGTLREDNAIALLGIQFCMNSAFSLCLGAMLKTMTGEAPPNTSTTSSVSSSTTPHPVTGEVAQNTATTSSTIIPPKVEAVDPNAPKP